jgi:hypothetical protein
MAYTLDSRWAVQSFSFSRFPVVVYSLRIARFLCATRFPVCYPFFPGMGSGPHPSPLCFNLAGIESETNSALLG